MKRIVWLASYPKSGNTWVRAFLQNLLDPDDDPADINDLRMAGLATDRWTFLAMTGLDPGLLTAEEIANARPRVYGDLARRAEETVFIKVHDRCGATPGGFPLFPPESTKAVVYIVRNPLDVVVSAAEHWGGDPEEVALWMGSERSRLSSDPRAGNQQLPHVLGSWSSHVCSWLDSSPGPAMVVRYEDLAEDAVGTFRRLAEHLAIEATEREIERAVRFSAFEELAGQERKKGFVEGSAFATRFFREGNVGSWRASLGAPVIRRILEDHRETMTRLGYRLVDGGMEIAPLESHPGSS